MTTALSPNMGVNALGEHDTDAGLGQPVAGQRFEHPVAGFPGGQEYHEQERRVRWSRIEHPLPHVLAHGLQAIVVDSLAVVRSPCTGGNFSET